MIRLGSPNTQKPKCKKPGKMMLICWKKRENWHCPDPPYISKISDATIAEKCAPESFGKAIWCSGWYNVLLACINYPPMGRAIHCEQSIAQ